MSEHHTRPDHRGGLAAPARRRSRPRSPGAVWTGIVLACLAAVVPTVPRALSTAAVGARPAASLPTIVLVHGAWADGSGWEGVVRRLQSDGYPVVVPANPLRGLPGDSAYVAGVLRSVAGPVILVGHSYGGAVITNAALGNPAVKALVYVDAFVPDVGETVLQLATAQPGSCLGGDPTAVFDLVPAAPAGDVDLYIKRNLFSGCFANDVLPADAAVLAASQRPVTLSALGQPSGVPAWRGLPSWYVVGTADRVLPPAEQRIMARRAGSHITEVDAGHPAMISHPDVVTGVIREAARAGA
jgi:pimeloyl-ACP methyl ester carboxylesterase